VHVAPAFIVTLPIVNWLVVEVLVGVPQFVYPKLFVTIAASLSIALDAETPVACPLPLFWIVIVYPTV
jgi:hypothetical protein